MSAMIMGMLGVLFWPRSIILHAYRSSFPDQPHPSQINGLLERVLDYFRHSGSETTLSNRSLGSNIKGLARSNKAGIGIQDINI
jgi:hypothetical protein